MSKQILYPTDPILIMKIIRSILAFLVFVSIADNAFSSPDFTLLSREHERTNWVDQPIRKLSISKTNNTTTRYLTIDKPDSIQLGDVLILNIAYSKSNNDATLPTATGWTHVASASYSNRGNYRALIMYKIVNEADISPAGYTFDFVSNLNGAVGAIAAFRNVNTSSGSPFDLIPGSINTSSSANIASVVANGLLTSSDNAGILMLTQSDEQVTWNNTLNGPASWRTTSPGFLEEIYDVPFNGRDKDDRLSIGMAWAVKTNAGSTGNGLVDQSVANRYGAILLALKPVFTTPQVPSITSSLSASSNYGSVSNYTITASFEPTSFSAVNLPTGMTLDAATGVISLDANTAAGSYAISLSATNVNGTGNSSTLNYTVNKKALTITADNVLKCFGTTHTFNTALFTSSGLVPGETITAVNMTSNGVSSAAVTGTYSIVPSGATGANGFLAENYEITYQTTGTLSVRPLNSWHGSVSTAWTNTANWCLASAQVPGAADAAIIYPSNNSPELGDAYTLYDLTINSGASVLLKTANTLTLMGSLTNDGLLNMETNTRVILGNGAQSINGNTITSFVNLTVNSASNITLNQSIQVTNNLTLTSGYLVPSAGKFVSIGNGATVSGASNNSYVRGAVKKIGTNGNANYTFSYPIGKPTLPIYDPVGITFPNTSSTDDVTVSYHEAAFNTSQKNNNIREVAPEYWSITPGSLTANNTSGLNVKLHYKSTGGGNYFTNATNVSYYKVGHYSDVTGTWEVAVGLDAAQNSTDAGSTLVEGFATANGVTAFSRFTMLEITASVLPVTLTHFSARVVPGNKVVLNWSTANELQCKGFQIEKASLSSQGKFQHIAYVFSKGLNGSSSTPLHYSFTFNIPQGETYAYFRILQQDIDGKMSPSEIKLVKFNLTTPINVAVSSSTGLVTVTRNPGAKKMNFRVTDQLGRIVSEQKGIVDQVFISKLPGSGILTIHLHIPETGEQLIKRVLVQK